MLQATHDNPVDQEVENWDGYPALNVKDFQEKYRIPAAIAPVVIVQQMVLGMAEVNLSLAAWKATQEANGADEITDKQFPIYQEAVFARAYFWLVPMLVTLYFTGQSEELDDEKATKQKDFVQRSDAMVNLLQRMTDPTTDALGGDITAEVL